MYNSKILIAEYFLKKFQKEYDIYIEEKQIQLKLEKEGKYLVIKDFKYLEEYIKREVNDYQIKITVVNNKTKTIPVMIINKYSAMEIVFNDFIFCFDQEIILCVLTKGSMLEEIFKKFQENFEKELKLKNFKKHLIKNKLESF